MDDLRRLSELAERLQEAKKTLADREADLARAAREVEDLEQNQIPELMGNIGIESFRSTCGLEITLGDFIKTQITEVNRAAAMAWLKENGHGGMIKNEITVLFGKGQDAVADSLFRDLDEKFEAVKQAETVHPMTLLSWVRHQIEDGTDFPQELFNVYVKKVAKVK